MANEYAHSDALSIPLGILGSWSSEFSVSIISTIYANVYVDYAPGLFYDILNMENPYETETHDDKLLLYYIRVRVTGVGANDTYWLGPFCAKLINGDEEDRYKLSIISEFPGQDDININRGWSIVPSHPIDPNGVNGFNEDNQMTILSIAPKLNYHDIYNNRFIDATYDDNSGEFSLIIEILCPNGKCSSAVPTHMIVVDEDGKQHIELSGSAVKGCTDDFNITDCLPTNKYENNSSCVCESCIAPNTNIYKIIIGFLVAILTLILLKQFI